MRRRTRTEEEEKEDEEQQQQQKLACPALRIICPASLTRARIFTKT